MFGRDVRLRQEASQREEVFAAKSGRAGALSGILQWTYICLYDILYANEKDGTIPQGTAAGEAPEAIQENWRTRRRIGSPRHRCVSAFEEEGIENGPPFTHV